MSKLGKKLIAAARENASAPEWLRYFPTEEENARFQELIRKAPLSSKQQARLRDLAEIARLNKSVEKAQAALIALEVLKNHPGILGTLTGEQIREITSEPFGPAKQIGEDEDAENK